MGPSLRWVGTGNGHPFGLRSLSLSRSKALPFVRKPTCVSGSSLPMTYRNARRATRRSNCGACGGAGSFTTTDVVKCGECKGAGWVRIPPDSEKVCPTCKGFQRVQVPVKSSCKSCKGQGFVVELIEIREVEKTRDKRCSTCRGNGSVTKLQPQDPVECPTCDGTGHDFDAASKGLLYSKSKCPRCRGSLYVRTKSVREYVQCTDCGGSGKTREFYWEKEERVVG